jgi:hypothetical protein
MTIAAKLRAFRSRDELPRQEHATVRCKVLKPFRWGRFTYNATGSIRLCLEPVRERAVGEILDDVLLPDAESLAALGRVEVVRP